MAMWKLVGGILCFVVTATVLGCGHYYKITEPGSGKTYYTTDIEKVRGGAIKFKNDRTGDSVTLQNSDVKEMSETDYKAAVSSAR